METRSDNDFKDYVIEKLNKIDNGLKDVKESMHNHEVETIEKINIVKNEFVEKIHRHEEAQTAEFAKMDKEFTIFKTRVYAVICIISVLFQSAMQAYQAFVK